jgi:hypothetical protein
MHVKFNELSQEIFGLLIWPLKHLLHSFLIELCGWLETYGPCTHGHDAGGTLEHYPVSRDSKGDAGRLALDFALRREISNQKLIKTTDLQRKKQLAQAFPQLNYGKRCEMFCLDDCLGPMILTARDQSCGDRKFREKPWHAAMPCKPKRPILRKHQVSKTMGHLIVICNSAPSLIWPYRPDQILTSEDLRDMIRLSCVLVANQIICDLGC